MIRRSIAMVPLVVAATLVAPASAAPRPALDVYLVVDTSLSTGLSFRDRMADVAAIVQAIDVRRIDLRVGLADFRDLDPTHPVTPTLPTAVTWRRLALTADRAALRPALDRLVNGGAGDEPEDQGRALEAAAGIDVWPYAEHGSAAGFRPNAYRLALLVTDASWHKGGTLYTPYADVIRGLVDRKVHVGTLVISSYNNMEAALGDGIAAAKDTRTTVRRGIACTGEPEFDVAPGGPFACRWNGERRLLPLISAGIASLVGR